MNQTTSLFGQADARTSHLRRCGKDHEHVMDPDARARKLADGALVTRGLPVIEATVSGPPFYPRRLRSRMRGCT